MATLPPCKGKIHPDDDSCTTAPDVSVMVDDGSNGGERGNLTDTNAIQDEEDDFYISSDTLDAAKRDESQTLGK